MPFRLFKINTKIKINEANLQVRMLLCLFFFYITTTVLINVQGESQSGWCVLPDSRAAVWRSSRLCAAEPGAQHCSSNASSDAISPPEGARQDGQTSPSRNTSRFSNHDNPASSQEWNGGHLARQLPNHIEHKWEQAGGSSGKMVSWIISRIVVWVGPRCVLSVVCACVRVCV